MTESEAISAIQNDLKWHSKELKPAYKEALKMAIKALEKQIPKKVVISNTESLFNTKAMCPECKELVYDEDGECPGWHPKYCDVCGQKLDFGEGENSEI